MRLTAFFKIYKILLTRAREVISQLSSAIAYLHAHRLYQCAIRADAVVLMQRVFTDPVAKLADLSQCRFSRRKVSWVANKRFDISKFKFKIPRARTSELQGSFSAVSK